MAAKPKPFADQLIEAVREGERKGITRYRLALFAKTDQTQLSRLVRRKMLPKMAACERIAAALGYRIMLVKEKTT